MSSKGESSTEDDISNWEMVSGHQADDDGSDSDSSIEVVSMDMDHEPVPLGAAGPPWGPVFVLRVPSNEKDDLTTESEESDEGDNGPTRGLRMVCHRSTDDSAKLFDSSEMATESTTEDSTKLSDSSEVVSLDSAKLSDSSEIVSDGLTEDSRKLSDSSEVVSLGDSAKLSDGSEMVSLGDSAKLSDGNEMVSLGDSAKLSDGSGMVSLGDSAKLSDGSEMVSLGDSAKLSDGSEVDSGDSTEDSTKLSDSRDVAYEGGIEDAAKMSAGGGAVFEAVPRSDSENVDNIQGKSLDKFEAIPIENENAMAGAMALPATNDQFVSSKDEELDNVSKDLHIEESLCDSHIQRPLSLENSVCGQNNVESPVTGFCQEPNILLAVNQNFAAVDQKINILDFVKNQNQEELPMVEEENLEHNDNENPFEVLQGNQGNEDEVVNDHNEAVDEGGIPANEQHDEDEDEIRLEDVNNVAEQDPVLVQLEQPVDAVQDDTETESSNEFEPEDDRIESDQSDLHTPDNSNLSNLDIADLLMDNHAVLRGYIHQPNLQLNLTLNYVVGIVLVIVVGMGIGHSIGSSFRSHEHISSEQQRMSVIWELRQQIQECHKQVIPELENVKQELHQCQSKSLPDLELENQQLMAAYQRLREKANFLQNEVTELREEVTKLKYKGLTAIIVQPSSAISENAPYQDKKNHLLNKINSLEQERLDLMTAVAVSRYGKPPAVVDDFRQLTQQIRGEIQPKETSKTNEDIDKIDDKSDERENEKIADEIKMVFERYGTTDKNLLIYKLSRDLDWMMSKVALWEKLYKEEKEKTVGSCHPKGDMKLEDILHCFGKLTKDYVRFSNFTEVFEKHWKQWMQDSYSNVKHTMDILSQFMTSADSKQEFKSSGNSGEKFQDNSKSSGKTDDKWSDAMRDLFNKTKASVSNVNEQLQETWKQVKNLSNDFWKKHQPSYCALKKEISEKITKMTNHFSKWVNKSRCEKRHSVKKRWKEYRGKYASTKRRWFENKPHHDGNKHFKTCKKYNRKGEKMLTRAKKKLHKLNIYKFRRMNNGDVLFVYKKFEELGHNIHWDCLDRADGEWFQCQKLWWFNALHGVYVSAQNCNPVLAEWQVRMINDPSNHSKSNYENKRKFKKKHFKHSGNSDKEQFKHASFKSEHGYQGKTNCFEDFSLNLKDMQEESNSTLEESQGNQEDTWYMKQMKARALERQREEGKKNSKWLFDRAEERDYQRTIPEDWYSQRMKNDGH